MAPSTAAIEAACRADLHRSFTLPASDAHPELRVSYSLAGPEVSDDAGTAAPIPTLLFIGGMFGGRYMCSSLHDIATRIGVRVIGVDRPGLGGSTVVPTAQRLAVWLETVPALLAHLNVKHVALASHSAGTIFCLNTLYKLSDILHPRRPYVVLLAPWVHPDQSGSKLMKLVTHIPTSVMSAWSDVNRFIGSKVLPVTSWSAGLATTLLRRGDKATEDDREWREMIEEAYGRSYEEVCEVFKLINTYRMAENMKGGNDEAIICAKTAGPGLWGVCEDYGEFTKLLKAKLTDPSWNTQSEPRKLKVQLFFAESDVMIGKQGQTYFEDCWWDSGLDEIIDLDSCVIPYTDHDGVCLLENGAIQQMLRDTKESFS